MRVCVYICVRVCVCVFVNFLYNLFSLHSITVAASIRLSTFLNCQVLALRCFLCCCYLYLRCCRCFCRFYYTVVDLIFLSIPLQSTYIWVTLFFVFFLWLCICRLRTCNLCIFSACRGWVLFTVSFYAFVYIYRHKHVYACFLTML